MIFTLGHSTLTEKEFITAARGMDVIADVRSHPGSRHVPHFNRSEMENWIPEMGIDLSYEWWPGLGGWTNRDLTDDPQLLQRAREHGVDVAAYVGEFPKQRIGAHREADSSHWTSQGLHDYSWYMTSSRFLGSVDLLVHEFGGQEDRNAAIICSEALWWKCHRSMIADYLTWRGCPCFHLPVKPPKHEITPRFKPHADAIGNRLERYDPAILEEWRSWCSQEEAAPSV